MDCTIEQKSIAPTLMLAQKEEVVLSQLEEESKALYSVVSKNQNGVFFSLCNQPELKQEAPIVVCCPIKTSSFSFDENIYKSEVL